MIGGLGKGCQNSVKDYDIDINSKNSNNSLHSSWDSCSIVMVDLLGQLERDLDFGDALCSVLRSRHFASCRAAVDRMLL
jgi:hypothetical protein